MTVLLAADVCVGATHKSVYIYCEAARVHWGVGCGGGGWGGLLRSWLVGGELFSH